MTGANFPQDAIDTILRPQRIAVVGASKDPDRIGGRPVRYLLEAGFAGEVVGVNPKYDAVQGVPCFPAIGDIPGGTDLAVLAVPAGAVVDALDAAGSAGARAAIVFGGGFAENGPDGIDRQAALVEVAGKHRLAVLGPNCLGVVSFRHRNYATLSTSVMALVGAPAGRVALLSQSGGFATNAAMEAAVSGARFSHLITSGNEAVLQFGDILEYLAADDETDAVVGYIEGVRDGERFAAGLAAMQAAGKPVSLLHVGRSRRGVAAVGAHTALMSDNTDAVDAALARYGARRLETFSDMVATAVGQGSGIRQGGLVVATISGGTAVYIVDVCERLGIELADLSEHTTAQLVDIVPSYGSLTNPVDLTAQVFNDLDSLVASMRVLAADPRAGNVLLFLGGYEEAADDIVAALAQIPATGEGRLWLSWLGVSEAARSAARAAGVRTYGDPAECLRAIAASARAVPRPIEVRATAPGIETGAVDDVTDRDDGYLHLGDGRVAVDEWLGMSLLEDAGVRVPPRWRIEDDDSLAAAADQVRFPCVLKLLLPHLPHRSAAGAVFVGLRDATELVDAWRALQREHGATAALAAPQCDADGELIVGVLRDAAFTVRAVVGSGGVRANDLDDHVTLIPPFTEAYVADVLPRLDGWQALDAGRAHLARDVTRVLQAMELILRRHPRLQEFESNPVLVTADGLIAVDALGTGDERRP